MIADGCKRGISLEDRNVRATEDLDKWQTRRVVRPIPSEPVAVVKASNGTTFLHDWDGTSGTILKCPYGAVGDLLYVKQWFAWDEDESIPEHDRVKRGHVWYRSHELIEVNPKPEHLRWRQPRYMWRWAARLVIKLAEIRLERVQDITPQDAIAEGITESEAMEFADYGWPHVQAYKKLWDSINGEPREARCKDFREYVSFPWESDKKLETHKGRPHTIHANPWVWALTYTLERKA